MERRKKNGKTKQKPGGGWYPSWEEAETMEMMGVVTETYELRGGALGSCVAQECQWGWNATPVDLLGA